MASLWRRDIDWGDDFDDDHDDRYYSYWGYDRTAFIVKWVLIAVLLFLIVLWLVGGYFHAQRRMKKGLPPMLYHRFLVPRHQRARFFPEQYGYYNQGYHGQAYAMHPYPPPPPPYNPQHMAPPTYQPPEGGTKVNPQQQYPSDPQGPATGPSNSGEVPNVMNNVPLNPGPPAPPGPSAAPFPPASQETELLPRQPKPAGFLAKYSPFKRSS